MIDIKANLAKCLDFVKESTATFFVPVLAAAASIQGFNTAIGSAFNIYEIERNSRLAQGLWPIELVAMIFFIACALILASLVGIWRPARKLWPEISALFFLYIITTNFASFESLYSLKDHFGTAFGWFGSSAFNDSINYFLFSYFLPTSIFYLVMKFAVSGGFSEKTSATFKKRQKLWVLILAMTASWTLTTVRVPDSIELVINDWNKISLVPQLPTVFSPPQSIENTRTSYDGFILPGNFVNRLGEINNNDSINFQITDTIALQKFLKVSAFGELMAVQHPSKSAKLLDLPIREVGISTSKFINALPVEVLNCPVQLRLSRGPLVSKPSLRSQGKSVVGLMPILTPEVLVFPDGTQAKIFDGDTITNLWVFEKSPQNKMLYDFNGDDESVRFHHDSNITLSVAPAYLTIVTKQGCSALLRRSLGLAPSDVFDDKQMTLWMFADPIKKGTLAFSGNREFIYAGKQWPKALGGAIGRVKSSEIDGRLTVNGVPQQITKGQEITLSNVTPTYTGDGYASFHSRSSDGTLAGHFISKKLIIFLSWEYWTAIASIALALFGWLQFSHWWSNREKT